jgi:hypothetical protein
MTIYVALTTSADPFVGQYRMPFMFLMPLQALTTTTMQQLKLHSTFQKAVMLSFLRLMGSKERGWG